MRATFVLLICAAVLATSLCDEKYDTRYDTINIDEILGNERLMQIHIKCLLDKGPCTKDGRELKRELPNAIETNCAKCTDAQKNLIRKACKHMIEKRAEDWKVLVNKYDPTGEHQEAFDKFLNET